MITMKQGYPKHEETVRPHVEAADSFDMDTNRDGLAEKLKRAERRLAMLERIVEDRDRELRITQEQAAAVHAYLLGLNDTIPGALITTSSEGVITRVNRGVSELLGFDQAELPGKPLSHVWQGADDYFKSHVNSDTGLVRDEVEWIAKDGSVVAVMLSRAPHRDADGTLLSVVFVGIDLRDRRRLELELRHAQKLEALGALSAGVAHEINTPMQFVGDNLHFIAESFDGLIPFVDQLLAVAPALEAKGLGDLAVRLREAEEKADLAFVRERLPKAIQRALEGVGRVSGIVEAMKAFSHPQSEMAPIDINKNLVNTLTVARNEYKYVAEIETELGELPHVTCNGSDMNQVFLNLVVNAAHAIGSAVQGTDKKGLIKIRTAQEDDMALIAISDNGTGIPPAIRHRIFDPFFTTKEVGKGTGQGLAISRSVVVERHGGSLTFDTEIGQGTTFYVRIPIQGRAQQQEVA
jgi:PAS domain S-box-containing protein